ncbi:MAG: hypothetical protein ABIQ31_22920 [Ferruginibacter sp.]
MLQNISRNRKATGLILIGLAAYAFYRYSKMTEEEKDELVDTITSTGKNIFNKIIQANSANDTPGTEDASYTNEPA